MARRRRWRRRFGAPVEVHHERSQNTLREIRRLVGRVKRHLRSPPDCEAAADLVVALAQAQGSYLIDRFEGGRYRRSKFGPPLSPSSYGGAGPRAVIRRFVNLCVVKPKSAAAARKMRAVWR